MSYDHALMGGWARIDELERELIAEQMPAPIKLTGMRGLLARIRSYLPGAHNNETWGKPSAHVYFHQVHICQIM